MSKKILLLFLLVTVLLSGCGSKPFQEKKQVNNKETQIYVTPIPCSKEELMKQYPDRFDSDGNVVYPLKPNSKEFEKRSEEVGYEKAIAEIEMPEDLIKRLDTKTLLRALEDNPYWLPMNIYNDMNDAIECMPSRVYGMEELLKREDAYYAAYQSYTKREVETTGDEFEDGKLMAEVLLEEYLLFQEYGYRNLTKEEREEVRKAVKRNREAEKKMHQNGADPVYIEDDMNASYNLEVLLNQEDNPWKEYLSQ